MVTSSENGDPSSRRAVNLEVDRYCRDCCLTDTFRPNLRKGREGKGKAEAGRGRQRQDEDEVEDEDEDGKQVGQNLYHYLYGRGGGI